MVDGINYICSVLHLYWYTSIGISQNKFYLKLSCSCVAVARTTFSAQHRITQQQQRKNTKFVLSPTHEFKKKKNKKMLFFTTSIAIFGDFFLLLLLLFSSEMCSLFFIIIQNWVASHHSVESIAFASHWNCTETDKATVTNTHTQTPHHRCRRFSRYLFIYFLFSCIDEYAKQFSVS